MLKVLSNLTDLLLGLIMWPLAAAVIYYYPDIFYSFTASVSSFIINANPAYLAGAVFFLLFRFNLLPFIKFPGSWTREGKISLAQRLDTWEHERAHWFFAILTFKFGARIEVLDKPSELGHIGYMSTPDNTYNWLITIGPYFFPTFTFLLLPLIFIPYEPLYPFLQFLLGWSILFHIVQNIADVKRNWSPSQGSYTDLTTLVNSNMTWFSILRSRIFAIIMIPALNFVVFTYILMILERNF